MITGEADEVKKEAGDTLLSGSFVVSGKARARLERVGDESFAAGLSKDAKKIKKKQQPGMMKSLTRLIQIIGIIIIPFGVLMFWNQHHMLGLSEKISMENTARSHHWYDTRGTLSSYQHCSCGQYDSSGKK